MPFPTPDFFLSDPSELPSPSGYAGVQHLHFSKSITTAMLALNAVTAIALMPANTRYVWMPYAKATDMDTNGTPTLALHLGVAGVSDITYDNVNAFLAASTIGQAGTTSSTMLTAGLGLLVPVRHYITLTASTGAATAAAGTFTLGLGAVLGSQ